MAMRRHGCKLLVTVSCLGIFLQVFMLRNHLNEKVIVNSFDVMSYLQNHDVEANFLKL
jgi:hypothetical protein